MGTHISKIRSTTLDVWTAEQIAHFQTLGNKKSSEIYEGCLPPGFQRPPSTDAFSMENFIRSKYERRAFSTPEHGGGGGNAPSNVSHFAIGAQAYVSSNLRDRSLGVRPAQNLHTNLPARFGAYNNEPQPRTALNSHSYSSQFRSNSHTRDNIHGTSQVSLGAWGASSTSKKSSIFSSLVEMGFPEDLVEESVARYGNDLQKAADWILKQKSVRLYSAPASRSVLRPSPRCAPAMENLMDLPSDLPVLTQSVTSTALPKALASESLIANVSTVPTQGLNGGAVSAPEDDDDDFADFGAFQSALPAGTTGAAPTADSQLSPGPESRSKISSFPVSPPSSVRVSKVNGNVTHLQTYSQLSGASLNATLAGLYANGLAKKQSGFKSPLKNSVPSASPCAPASASSPVPRTSQGQNSKPSTPSIDLRKVGNTSTGSIYKKPDTPPPPPLPSMFDSNISAPPPPSPTSLEPVSLTALRSDDIQDSTFFTEANNSSQTRMHSEPSNSNNVKTEDLETAQTSVQSNTTPPDDDPFAFLAKEALSSATSKKKNRSTAKDAQTTFADPSSSINKAIKVPPASTGTNSGTNTTSAFSFEDLLG